jgi:hypothetical protein
MDVAMDLSVTMRRTLPVLLGFLFLAGCQGQKTGSRVETRIQHNLAALSPADRQLAEQQKFCAVQTDNELGSMGVPIKITLKGQTVFLCCKGCRKTAEAEPDKTLASAKALREANAPGKASAHSGS